MKTVYDSFTQNQEVILKNWLKPRNRWECNSFLSFGAEVQFTKVVSQFHYSFSSSPFVALFDSQKTNWGFPCSWMYFCEKILRTKVKKFLKCKNSKNFKLWLLPPEWAERSYIYRNSFISNNVWKKHKPRKQGGECWVSVFLVIRTNQPIGGPELWSQGSFHQLTEAALWLFSSFCSCWRRVFVLNVSLVLNSPHHLDPDLSADSHCNNERLSPVWKMSKYI